MKEILELAISPQVLPLTILLVPVALYWVLNMLGAVDLDFLDVDFDTDGPDGDSGDSGGMLSSALRIVNAKDVPLMVVLSVLVILLWTCAMLGNLWFNQAQSGTTGGIVALGSLAGAVILTRFVVAPLKPLFRLLKSDDEKHVPVIGRTGIVRTAEVDERSGQVEIENAGAPLYLNARVAAGSSPLPRDAEVIVIAHDADTGVYTVRSLSADNPPQ
ncbi:hypothetical protein [Luteolibacter marinus]|uniref:hypothetical protein n=1 Tax=Luteolibacter marinus TaxID=2776705 RepID=UPI0018677211|nr:hypothetical protein [Luteolibacter marinus]